MRSKQNRHAEQRGPEPFPAAQNDALDCNVPSRERSQRAPRARPDRPTRCHGSNPEEHFGRGPGRDLVDQCSAYACPMRAHARLTRRTTSTCRSPRNRSSPVTSRRAHPAYACVCRIDKAPRKTPEKLGSSTRVPARTRWSQRCAYAKGRDKPDELVAGVIDQRATVGFTTR